MRPPRKPNRLRDTAELIVERANAIPPRTRMVAAGVAGALVVGVLVVVVLHPFDASNAAPQASARSTATPPSPTALVNAFFRQVRDPQAGFHVTVSGAPAMASGGKQTHGSIRGDIEVRGDDLSGLMRSTPGDGSLVTFDGQLTRSAGRSWTRAAGASVWKPQVLPPETDVLNPFAWIATADEVTFEAATGSAVQGPFTLRVETWVNGAQYDALLATLTDVDRQGVMDVEVDARGIPSRATYRYSLKGKGRTGSQVTVSGTLQYAFDAWGQVGPIGPPS